MNWTYIFNVCGAPGMGIGVANVATAVEPWRAVDAPKQSLPPGIGDGLNACVRTGPTACLELRMFGRTF